MGLDPPLVIKVIRGGGGSGLRNMGVKFFKGILSSGDGVPVVGGGLTLV